MHCVVYKSIRQFDYFLYVEQEDDFSRVPDSLKELLGELKQVIQIELHERRTLAQVDVKQVIQQLEELGYYLQMPAKPVGKKSS